MDLRRRNPRSVALLNLVTRALPVSQEKIEAVSHVGSAVMAGVVDTNPTDPIEGVLISQLVVANEAALSLYRRAWACNPADYFDAHAKYLQLADKASRTVAMLTERLDQHRGRGQQQITVKHVTVNADQAVVADQIVSGKEAALLTSAKDAALLTSGTEKPLETWSRPTLKRCWSRRGRRASPWIRPITRRAAPPDQSGADSAVVRPR